VHGRAVPVTFDCDVDRNGISRQGEGDSTMRGGKGADWMFGAFADSTRRMRPHNFTSSIVQAIGRAGMEITPFGTEPIRAGQPSAQGSGQTEITSFGTNLFARSEEKRGSEDTAPVTKGSGSGPRLIRPEATGITFAIASPGMGDLGAVRGCDFGKVVDA
jgi:hypothetical protein